MKRRNLILIVFTTCLYVLASSSEHYVDYNHQLEYYEQLREYNLENQPATSIIPTKAFMYILDDQPGYQISEIIEEYQSDSTYYNTVEYPAIP